MNKSAFGFNQLTPKNIENFDKEAGNFRDRDRRNLREYPDHIENTKKGKYITHERTFDEQLDQLIYQSKEERPTALRSNIVEKYVREVLNKKKNPKAYELKLSVVKQMIKLNFDNRVLNNMRQTMNESIEDERGHMLKTDFKRMLFTAFGKVDDEKKK